MMGCFRNAALSVPIVPFPTKYRLKPYRIASPSISTKSARRKVEYASRPATGFNKEPNY
jgi:hypothetical protein